MTALRLSRPGIVNTISRTAFALGMAIALLGGATASANGLTVQQRAEAEMNKGKDYVAAWQAAMRTVAISYDQGTIERAKKTADQMNQGKDYVAARDATREATRSTVSPEQIATAKRAQDAMNEGKDYVAAWEAARRVQPTSAPTLLSANVPCPTN